MVCHCSGGVVHGPIPKDWSLKLQRKVRHKALLTALSTRYQQGDLEVIDDIRMPSRKTKVGEGWRSLGLA